MIANGEEVSDEEEEVTEFIPVFDSDGEEILDAVGQVELIPVKIKKPKAKKIERTKTLEEIVAEADEMSDEEEAERIKAAAVEAEEKAEQEKRDSE